MSTGTVARTAPVPARALAGTGRLVRLFLRRDRISMPLWVVLFGLAPGLYVASVHGLYPTDAALAEFAAATAASPAQIALYGPMFGAGLGSVGVWKAGAYFTLIAVATILTVIRHTRAEEEAGRTELTDSTMTGRFAGLSAALLAAGGAALLSGTICAIGLLAQDLPAAGSLAFGTALALSGIVWAAVAGLAAQLSASARICRGIAFAALGTAFALRAAGDAGNGVLSWFSPLGWALQIRAFAGERWWVIAPLTLAAVAATAVAYLLAGRRDLGAGVIAPRSGAPTAGASLSGPLTLAWRMHRGTLLAWTVGLGLYGLLIGSAAKGVGDQLGDSETIRDLVLRMGGSRSLELSFVGYAMTMLGIAASAYAVSAALRLHSEESAGRLEPLLAQSVSRMRWAAGHLVMALLGPAVAMTAAGVCAGVAYGGRVGSIVGAALVQVPAIWVSAGIVVALFGVVPRFAPVAWGVLVAFLTAYLIGSIGNLPSWVADLAPFAHPPKLPGGTFTAAPLLWLTGIAAALVIVGLTAFRRRDLQ